MARTVTVEQFPMVFTVDVGYSTRYDPPHARIRPDERVRRVVVSVHPDDSQEATLTAAYMVMCRRDCAMVTSTTVVAVEW